MKFIIKKEKDHWVLLSETPVFPVPEEGEKNVRRYIRGVELIKGRKILEDLAHRIFKDSGGDPDKTPIEVEE